MTFAALLQQYMDMSFLTYIYFVEQDILPGMGSPKDGARRNREYLKSIESNFA